MVRDRAMRDDVGFGPLPVVSHSGVFDGSGASAGRLACVFAVAGLLCVSSAQGQVIREEGFPVKGGVPEESAWAPVVREECDPFTVPGEFGESCAPREKTPDPFGFGPEGEARPGEPSGPAWRTPPRLECPVAIFLEELETGQVECHAWDASGEEHLEYSWEPVGSTTRDYLDNPRLMPEDVPNPSVVAPEAPAYETLESFYSGETTFLYRYRLTATSRATGLSSWREVEVYVSGSRPSVYCPLEVSVEEGETIALDCEGADPLSHRMDYDEDGASILWEWEGLWGTSMAPLAATDLSSPLFTAPAGSAGEEYHYIASMTSQASGVPRTARRRVTVRVVGEEEVSGYMLDPGITCSDSPYEVYEGASDLGINCSIHDQPARTNWVRWSRLGEQIPPPASGAPTPGLKDPYNIDAPSSHYRITFDVPDLVNQDEMYAYTVALYTPRYDGTPEYTLRASADFTVTVLNKPAITVTCEDTDDVDEGADDIEFDCSASGAPGGDPDYTWSWSPTDNLTGHNTATPTFAVPDNVDQETTYTYTVTASAENADDGAAEVRVTVLDTDTAPPPSITCSDAEAYEGTGNFTLDCSVANEPTGATYSWTGTDIGNRLSGTDGITPTFAVPVSVSANTDYEYTVTLSAGGVEQASEDVTVTVLNKPAIDVDCAGNPYEVYEGSGYTTLDCSASGAPSGSDYDYVWTAREGPPNELHIRRLSATDISSPTFRAPPFITRDVTYEYRLTVSAENAEPAREDVTVTVLDRGLPGEMVCNGTYFERYAGSDDIELSCRSSRPVGVFRWLWAAWSADGLPYTISSGGGYPTGWPRPQGLTVTGLASGTFRMPATVNSATTYKYTIGVWRGRCPGGCAPLTVDLYASQDITIRVLPRPAIAVTCADPDPVYEGSADIELECEASGAPSGSSYTWLWSPTDRLTDHDTATPTFDVPYDVPQDTTYAYTVTASAENAEDGRAEVTVTVLHTDAPRPVVTCNDTAVYEGAADITLDCSVTNAPSDAAYSWAGTDVANRLSGTDGYAPTFTPPDNVDADTDYDYTVTLSAGGAADVTEDVTVTVLKRPVITVTCADPGSVYEGSEDITFDCAASGAPAGSAYVYEWRAGGDTPDTALLSATDIASTTFAVPEEVEKDETYEYTLTVSAENAESGSADVTVTVLNKKALDVACATPSPVYEGSEDFALDCAASGAPSGFPYDVYAWTARGGGDTSRLSSTTVGKPTFYVPDEVAGDETYEYRLTVSAENADPGSADVTVTVLNKKTLDVACATPSPVYEGSADFALDCTASGAPGYTYVWTARGSTANTDLLISGVDGPTPTFDVPEEVDEDETYEYLLTVSAENADPGSADVTVQVLNKKTLDVACATPSPVYEGSADFALDCTASGAPGYTYVWTARGSTANTDLLISGVDGPAPTFDVPEEVDEDETYEYLLTVSADNAESATAEVTVKVLNLGSIALVCASPPLVYEGSEDFALDCSVSGDTGDVDYAYEWAAIGATPNTSRLSAVDISSPTFYVPDALDETTTYEYLLTARTENAEDAAAEVSVTVLNKGALSIACATPSPVYEGSADIAFDCSASGAPGDDPQYTYAWTARGDTPDTSLLSAVDVSSPMFYVPDEVDEDETYEYTLTVSADNAESVTEDVTVTVLNKEALALVCADPGSVYEGSADIAFDCSASGAPGDDPQYTYAWTARGDTPDTALLSAADIASPTFAVPDEVDEDETYEYLLTASADNAEDAAAEVSVTVLNKGALSIACATPSPVYEGSADIAFDCSASGAPGDDPQYTYAWTARGDTPDTSLLSAVDVSSPMFYVPDEVDEDETYEYTLTVSADNAESVTEDVTVTVLNKEALALVCADPGSVYEGSADIAFDCSASGAPGDDPQYTYAWTARGDTPDTALLSAADIASPTFAVPDEVDEDETYEYLLTASADNAEDAAAEVSVKVLNLGSIALVCASPPLVYEGSEDITFDCSVSGAPGDDPQYTYAWTARGDTPDTSLLSAVDVSSPMFYVPDEVDEDETYEYTLTVSADNAEFVTEDVTVTVLNKEALALVCADPGSVYEGSADIAFDCSASGAPGDDPQYTYAWTARGDTPDTALLSAADIASPTFAVPDEVDEDETYEYLLTASADNAEDAAAEVSVTVLNKGALSIACATPSPVYEGSADFAFDCSASGAPGDDPQYTYAWTARGDTPDTSLLSAVDVSSPMFYVPDEVDEDETYEYTLTVSADNAEFVTEDVTVTVLNKEALALVCADPGSVYEGSADIAFDCSASGAPGDDPQYTYAWTARGSTANTDLLISGTDGPTPTFAVPDEVDEDETYEYLLTASADNAEDAAAEVSVTVLNKGALSIACATPSPVYEGSADIAFDCSASGAPGDDPQYTYAWTARGDTPDTSLLSAVDIPSPTFYVPEEVEEDETYEYTLTVSAANAEDAAAEVTVTVLDRIRTPAPDPVSPPAEEPPVAGSSSRAPSDPTALGVTVSASSLRFGVQSAQTRASLDPMTDQISTRVSGPYHAGRMTLSPGGGASFDENGEMDLSIEVVSPVLLKREGAAEPSSLVLSPSWSFAESCEQLSSQAIGSLYTEATLAEGACRLLRFGGELDLTGAPSGRYAGSMDIVLRSGESEETHSVEVEVTVVPSQRVITIGPGGVRFSTSRELAAGLTEEQNLSIYPDVAFLTEGKPHGVFELSNPSLVPLEVSVSARFGYTEATRDGREVVVEDASDSRLGDLSQVVDIHPAVVVLQPGEKGLVRYGVQEGALAAMAEKGYAAFFDVVSSPRQYVRSDRMPEEVTGERTARVTMRVPGVYVPGEGASQLRATLLSLSYGVSMSATFLLETQDRPFAGEVVAYDGQGRELGRRETLVYTRSRVRVPLDRMPEEEVVFLRFAPWGPGRVPDPVNIPWNAPGRDIGAAGDKERRTIPKSALQ